MDEDITYFYVHEGTPIYSIYYVAMCADAHRRSGDRDGSHDQMYVAAWLFVLAVTAHVRRRGRGVSIFYFHTGGYYFSLWIFSTFQIFLGTLGGRVHGGAAHMHVQDRPTWKLLTCACHCAVQRAHLAS